MHILVVEDEPVAAKQLVKMISNLGTAERVDWVDSLAECMSYLTSNQPQLIFMDIHLGDGNCFEMLEEVDMQVPLIFTTAYDQYALQAFKQNSIDYLLKPIDPQELKESLDKFCRWQAPVDEEKDTKNRFLVRCGRGFVSIPVEEIAYIMSESKLNFLVNRSGRKYIVDYTLDQLERLLDHQNFQRVNRNFIISCQSVVRAEPYFNYRMLLQLEPQPVKDVVVSRTYLREFKHWMGQ